MASMTSYGLRAVGGFFIPANLRVFCRFLQERTGIYCDIFLNLFCFITDKQSDNFFVSLLMAFCAIINNRPAKTPINSFFKVFKKENE
jgi:hypothetical protein